MSLHTEVLTEVTEAHSESVLGALAEHAKISSLRLEAVSDSPDPVVVDEAICISSVYTFVRSERYKQLTQSKNMDGGAKDQSIRQLISTYRRLDEMNPEDFSDEELRKAALLKDESATIVFGYMGPAITALTRKYRGEWHEIAQRGAELGFWQAFTKFDPSYENEFMTYAGQLVKGVMQRTLRDDTLQSKMYGRATAEGIQAIRNLTDLGWTVEQAQQIIGMSEAEHQRHLHLNAIGAVGTITPVDKDGSPTEISIKSPLPSAEDAAVVNQTLIQVGEFLDNLNMSDKQEAIVKHVFGFYRNGEGRFQHTPGHTPDMTDTELAEMVGCSQSFLSRTRRNLSFVLRSAFEVTD